jgi:hypothetical protein
VTGYKHTVQKAELEAQMRVAVVEDVRRTLVRLGMYGGQKGFELVQTIYQRVPELTKEREPELRKWK